jgi:sugar fermentation stimulation protein A
MLLHTLPALYRAEVISRPSKSVKSPYVADVRLEDGSEGLCHTPGLSCCGLVSAGRTIYVTKSTSTKAKTAYVAQVSECTDSEGIYYVGIHPMIGQKVASCLLNKIADDVVWKSEVKLSEHTRLDYVALRPDGKKIYVEVKNAMISLSKEVRANRCAVFPEGFRKKKTDPFSPRAVKHAETLAELVKLPDTEAAYLVYLVSRDDCMKGLTINPSDPVYCAAIRDAMAAGVQVRVFGVKYGLNGEIEFGGELEFGVGGMDL